MQRIQKILSNSGFCSRREAEEIIIDGRVKVNGKRAHIGDNAEESDKILVDNKPIKKERKTYLLFHKPRGCVTALRDPKFKTVMDFIRVKERVFPVGRLDYNTTGLLLLTNDGDFANKIMHPSSRIKKTYLVELNRSINQSAVRVLSRGVNLEDGMTSPARVVVLGRQIVEITIHEGKNRIVKRMLETLGYRVRTLQRVKVGKLLLGSLKPGRYRVLKPKERDLIFR